MHIGSDLRSVKLDQLCRAEGYSALDELVAAAAADSVCSAICIEPCCTYTTEMEPDQDAGWCEECGKNTVVSALVLAGLI